VRHARGREREEGERELGQGRVRSRGAIDFYREGEGEAPRGGTTGHHHAIDGH
jgi:hypothetical protein